MPKSKVNTAYPYSEADIGLVNTSRNERDGIGYHVSNDRNQTGILIHNGGQLFLDDAGFAVVELPASAIEEGMIGNYLENQLRYLREIGNPYPIKILFPYKLQGFHWNLGQIKISKDVVSNEVMIEGQAIDSYGSVNSSCSLEQELQNQIKNAFNKTNEFRGATFRLGEKAENVPHVQTGMACGLYAAHAMHALKTKSDESQAFEWILNDPNTNDYEKRKSDETLRREDINLVFDYDTNAKFCDEAAYFSHKNKKDWEKDVDELNEVQKKAFEKCKNDLKTKISGASYQNQLKILQKFFEDYVMADILGYEKPDILDKIFMELDEFEKHQGINGIKDLFFGKNSYGSRGIVLEANHFSLFENDFKNEIDELSFKKFVDQMCYGQLLSDFVNGNEEKKKKASDFCEKVGLVKWGDDLSVFNPQPQPQSELELSYLQQKITDIQDVVAELSSKAKNKATKSSAGVTSQSNSKVESGITSFQSKVRGRKERIKELCESEEQKLSSEEKIDLLHGYLPISEKREKSPKSAAGLTLSAEDFSSYTTGNSPEITVSYSDWKTGKGEKKEKQVQLPIVTPEVLCLKKAEKGEDGKGADRHYHLNFNQICFDESGVANPYRIFNDADLFMANFRGCVFKDVNFGGIDPNIMDSINFRNCKFEGNCRFPDNFLFKLDNIKGSEDSVPFYKTEIGSGITQINDKVLGDIIGSDLCEPLEKVILLIKNHLSSVLTPGPKVKLEELMDEYQKARIPSTSFKAISGIAVTQERLREARMTTV